ncbi:MAG: hypothetical protein ABI396_06055 [Ktedonobacteraceae bacterium]
MNNEPMSYLTAPLREVAQHHLTSDEVVLTAIYAHHTVLPAHDRWLWFTRSRQVHYPTRAFVLTTRRALIVEDPTDPVASTSDREYLLASCTIERVMFFEICSHLLDCALTLVMATPHGSERVTIKYNGASHGAFLGAVACMRAQIDDQPLPLYTRLYARPDESFMRERSISVKGWHAFLTGLALRQTNAVIRYLMLGERIHEWLSIPAIDESTWWQRLGIGAHEQPPTVLLCTDRQILLVKEARRIVRGQTTYGSEAWLMPLERLHMASIVSVQQQPNVQITLEHKEITEAVRFPVPPEFAERALALIMSHLPTRDDD